MRVMKIVNKELKRKGVTMKRYYDNFPLCCPSRTTILTGQYAHNHEVLSNSPPDGGYGVFNELHGDNYLPLWLQAPAIRPPTSASSRTGTPSPTSTGRRPTDVPRGWNDWHVLAPSRAQYFNYTLNQNGACGSTRTREEDYSTDVFTKKAKRFIRSNAQGLDPVLPRARLRGPARRRRRRPGPLVQPRRGAGAARPRDAEEEGEGLAAAVLQRGRRLRQAVAGRRPAAAHRRADLRHAAQAPLRLGVAARASTTASARCSTSSSATASAATPTSSSSPTTASCAASTGSATTSASSTRSRRGSRSSPAGPGSRTARAPTTSSSTPT